MMQMFKYMLVGVANTLLGYGIIFGCMHLIGLSPELSNTLGYATGLVISYFLNRRFTFCSEERRRAEFIRFVLVFMVAYLANIIVLVVLVRMFMINANWGQIIASVIYVGISYLLNKYYVFRASGSDSTCA